MATAAPNMQSRRATWVGYAACAWALLFAVAHFYWLLGGCTGFPAEACEDGFRNTWFVVYDVIAGILCVLGAAVILALDQPLERRVSRLVLLTLAWVGGVVLILRGGVGLAQDALIFAREGSGWEPTMVYDPWFLVGGVLFCAAAWLHGRGLRGGQAKVA